jgi:hypothetical protein
MSEIWNQRQTLMNMKMNLRFPQNENNFLIREAMKSLPSGDKVQLL